jgi:hypothetical protein
MSLNYVLLLRRDDLTRPDEGDQTTPAATNADDGER